MKVEISDHGDYAKNVYVGRARLGTIISYLAGSHRVWKFTWYGHDWMTLTYDEVTEIYAVVDKKLNMLNITARLMG